MVDPLDRGAAVDVALRHVLQPGAQVLGRHVAILLVEELEAVAVGIAEPVGGAVPVVALVPADAETGASIAATRRSSAAGLQARIAGVPEAGQLGLGQLEAVALVLAPPAQEHRLALAVLDLHAEQLDEELQAVLRERREQLGVGDVGEVVGRLSGHVAASTLSRRPSRS